MTFRFHPEAVAEFNDATVTPPTPALTLLPVFTMLLV